MLVELLQIEEPKMETNGRIIEAPKSQEANFPPWNIRDILISIIICYSFSHITKALLEEFIFKDMSLKFYGSIETIDKVAILGSGMINIIFFSSFLFITIHILNRYNLKLSDIGLNHRISLRWIIISLVSGIIYGHLIYFLIVFFLIGNPEISWKIIGPSGKLILNYALPVHMVTTVYASIVEEIFFRGMSYNIFKKTYGFIWGIFFSTIIFTVYHIQNITSNPMLSISIFISGICLCIIYEKSQSLLCTSIFHLNINLTAILFSYNIHPLQRALQYTIHQLF